jgi:hypothetical protein
MLRIRYHDPAHYQWAKEFLQLCNSAFKTPPRLYPATLELEIDQDQIEPLFQRISDPQQIAILPSISARSRIDHRWLIVGPDLQALERAVNRLRHLLVPTYAIFVDGPIAIFHHFSANEGSLFRLAARIYPNGGYCVLRSQPKDVHHVLQRLNMWLRLEEDRPAPQLEDIPPTYLALYERFQLALVTAQWNEAEEIRRKIQFSHLTTADNLCFLEIEQLAYQQRWQDIRQHPDFKQLTRTRIPRNVRAALLTAFHQTTLLSWEQQGQWEHALEMFHEKLPELGLLFTGRLGLTQGPVLQMFAYQAAVEKDRQTLLDLIDVNNDPDALQCIKQLLLLVEKTAIVETTPLNAPPLYMVMEALHNGNIDLAQQRALTIDDKHLKLYLLMNIASQSNDLTQASEVLLLFSNLPLEDQNELYKRFPLLPAIEKNLQYWTNQTVTKESTQLTEEKITNWFDWFTCLSHMPNDPLLISSQNKLTNDDRFWSLEHVQELNDYLLLLDEDTKRLLCVRDALQKLLSFFLSEDAEFPRAEAVCQDLYEILYDMLLAKTAQEEMKDNGAILLRLANTLLSRTPNQVEAVFHDLQKWSGKPIPKLEAWALEVLEMLIDYGIEPGLLMDWYREWAEQVIYRQTRYELAHVDGWLEFGRIIQPGDDLLSRLQQQTTKTLVERGVKDPIESLSEGYRIVIYTLQELAAQRARDLLLKRNSSVDIRICTDTVLSGSAKALAQNSDLVVMVITAMKHSLSYGLGPFLKKDRIVYPQSSGSTSIIRAIEEYVKIAVDL